MKKPLSIAFALTGLLASSALAAQQQRTSNYDVLIRGGTIYDGLGQEPFTGDVAIKGDRIVFLGPSAPGQAARVVDATGKAVSPGFINMLSWAVENLIADGRGMSDTLQGVTKFSAKAIPGDRGTRR